MHTWEVDASIDLGPPREAPNPNRSGRITYRIQRTAERRMRWPDRRGPLTPVHGIGWVGLDWQLAKRVRSADRAHRDAGWWHRVVDRKSAWETTRACRPQPRHRCAGVMHRWPLVGPAARRRLEMEASLFAVGYDDGEAQWDGMDDGIRCIGMDFGRVDTCLRSTFTSQKHRWSLGWSLVRKPAAARASSTRREAIIGYDYHPKRPLQYHSQHSILFQHAATVGRRDQEGL